MDWWEPSESVYQLRQPKGVLVLCLLAFLFFVGIAVISNLYANETVTRWTTGCFLAFAMLAAIGMVDYFVVRHEVSAEGLVYRNLLGKRGRFRWHEVRRVDYVSSLKSFRLETHTGEVARVSIALSGLPEFARLVIENVSAVLIERAALARLEAASTGESLILWQ